MREVLRNMPAISGTINQSEQFSDGGGTIVGLKNVNIRSLGIPRTLVLFNGKRIVNSAGTTKEGNAFVDVGNFPMIAMERIEVLKNGGAVSHGTDAMGGVFNFITRNKFEGFERPRVVIKRLTDQMVVEEAAFHSRIWKWRSKH